MPVATSRRPAAKRPGPSKPSKPSKPSRPSRPSPASDASALDPRFANGPLAVLDGEGSAYCVGGLILDRPARTLPALVDRALTEARLGAPRLNRNGKDADPLVVITAEAAERFGLPGTLEDRRGLRLPEDHKVITQLARAKWQLTRGGFGSWPRIYRPAQGGQRQCVQLAILPWGALDTRSWGNTNQHVELDFWDHVELDFQVVVGRPRDPDEVTERGNGRSSENAWCRRCVSGRLRNDERRISG
ncbi:hypothetical protein [Streptomyces inhibens]|uniref:hypothetical protein n=1 Tax=Streptomyces inhibens TaxID=2293571 RepID=UPI003CC949D4